MRFRFDQKAINNRARTALSHVLLLENGDVATCISWKMVGMTFPVDVA